jgi:glycosyltransferase involved in cell wall biosynthesis
VRKKGVRFEGKCMELVLLSDALRDTYGANRVVTLLASEFVRRYDVVVASVSISTSMREQLEAYSITPLDLNMSVLAKDSSISWIETFFRETFFQSNSKELAKRIDFTTCKLISFSCIFNIPTDIVYGLGFGVSSHINAFVDEMPWYYKLGTKMLNPVFSHMEKKLKENLLASKIILTISEYCTQLYEELGIPVSRVIYPPLDLEIYKPTTTSPIGDYVLTYLGKESKFSLIKKIADLGIPIKAFGSKLSYIPSSILNHSHIECLGHVSDETLIDLYTNAHYTFFPFTDEVFGYIPIESMACGTPTLTYAYQGPKETVSNGITGWLAEDDEELITLASKISDEGYSNNIRKKCRESSFNFDKRHIAKQWFKYLDESLQ